MAFILDDRVLELSNSSGMLDFVLQGPPPGYRAFANACQNGDTFTYCIDDVVNSQFEIGTGVYNFVANSITRQSVIRSSNGNQLVNFASGTTKQVYLTLSGADFGTVVTNNLTGTVLRTNVLAGAALVGTGNTQSTATPLPNQINVISSAPPGTAFVLPPATAGMVVEVRNKDASNVATILPGIGARIDSNALNASVSLPSGSPVVFVATSPTQWWA